MLIFTPHIMDIMLMIEQAALLEDRQIIFLLTFVSGYSGIPDGSAEPYTLFAGISVFSF